jgi:hypothetical protein
MYRSNALFLKEMVLLDYFLDFAHGREDIDRAFVISIGTVSIPGEGLMNLTCRWLALMAASILAAAWAPAQAQADVMKQPKYEWIPGVPQFPLDAMKKPTKAEIIYNLNVSDGMNAGQQKSIPIRVELDPANFPARPNNPALLPAWIKTMQELKAKAIVDAINKDEQIKANNKKLKDAGKAGEQTVAQYREGDVYEYDKDGEKVRKVNNGPHVRVSDLRYDLGQAEAAGRCPVYRTKDETKEPGGAAPPRVGKPQQPPPTPSPGGMGGKGKTSTGYQWDSTDENPIPSDVSFGYFDNIDGGSAFVATVFPLPGQTDDEILSLLASELMGMGVPVTYDSMNNLLTLNVDIGPNQTFWFDDTDPGLDFDIYHPAFGAFNVPEPSTALLLAMVSLNGLLLRRFGRR